MMGFIKMWIEGGCLNYPKFQMMLRNIVGDRPVNVVAREMGIPTQILLYYLTQEPVGAVPEQFLHRLCMQTPGRVSLPELAEAAGWTLMTGNQQAMAYGADFPKRALFNAHVWQSCAVDPRITGVAWNSLDEMVGFFAYVCTTERLTRYEISEEMPYSGSRHQPAPYFAYTKLYYSIGDLDLSQTVFLYFMHDSKNKLILLELGFLVADIIDAGYKITGGNGLQPNCPAVQIVNDKTADKSAKQADSLEVPEEPAADEMAVDQEPVGNMFITTFEGFGFEIYDEPTPEEMQRLMAFLQHHKDTLNHLTSGQVSVTNEQDVLALFRYADDETLCSGIGSVIAAIMCWETNIHFVFFRDMEGKFQNNRSCVMVLDGNWNDSLADIVYTYASELGLETFGSCYFTTEMEKDAPIETKSYKRRG